MEAGYRFLDPTFLVWERGKQRLFASVVANTIIRAC